MAVYSVCCTTSAVIYILCGMSQVVFTARGQQLVHRRQPHRGCRGRIPTNILVGGDINGNDPTNIRGGNWNMS